MSTISQWNFFNARSRSHVLNSFICTSYSPVRLGATFRDRDKSDNMKLISQSIQTFLPPNACRHLAIFPSKWKNDIISFKQCKALSKFKYSTGLGSNLEIFSSSLKEYTDRFCEGLEVILQLRINIFWTRQEKTTYYMNTQNSKIRPFSDLILLIYISTPLGCPGYDIMFLKNCTFISIQEYSVLLAYYENNPSLFFNLDTLMEAIKQTSM